MRLQLLTYQLRFPRELPYEAVQNALLSLAGQTSTRPLPLRLSARGHAGTIEHFLAVPVGRPDVIQRLLGLLPGLEADRVTAALPDLRFVWRLWQSSARRPLRSDRPELTARALLLSLMSVRQHEVLELRWLLGPTRRPLSVGSKHAAVLSESWIRALATAAFLSPGDLDDEGRRALREKLREPSWRILGQLAVKATDRRRARQLASNLMSAVRTTEGPDVQLGVRRSNSKQLDRLPWRWPLQLNAIELTGLVAWPIEQAAVGLPVAVQRHRQLEPRRPTASAGRLLGHTPSGRPVRLSREDALRHLHVLGPTGTGKSTLLLNLILQDIAHGHSIVVLDPKGDLVDDVLRRYPPKRLADLVILDPTDESPVGLNPLARPERPELVADQLLSIFSNLFRDSFGPRTADVLHASLLTLARWGQGSLAVLPLLLTNPALRRRIVGETADPLGTGPFWSWYERLSIAERERIVAPTMNKVRPFLRPDLRAVVAQAAPRFDLREIVTRRRVLLVNLASGQLGPDSSAWLGTVLLNQTWQTILARSSIAPQRRHQICVHVDEVQNYLRLPGDIGDLLAQARGLGASFTLAHQHLGQLPTELRGAVLANARSRVLFQLSGEDARVLAAGHDELTPLDLMRLPPFEAYAALLQANEVQPFISLQTAPPPAESTGASAMRAASRERFGIARSDTDDALRALISPTVEPDEPIGRRPRQPS